MPHSVGKHVMMYRVVYSPGIRKALVQECWHHIKNALSCGMCNSTELK